jgi:hypothetical protein
LSDLTNDPATNSPQGTESAKGVVDDYLRAHGAFIRQLSDELKGATVVLASSATVNIGFAKSANIAVTGSVTIGAFDVWPEGTLRFVQFLGAMTLTHNAAVLALPGQANILTVSGDAGVFKSNGAGKWTCILFQRQAGFITASQVAAALTGASINPANVTVSNKLVLADGTLAAPSLSWSGAGDTDTGLYHSGDGVINFVCNGVSVGRFTATGFEAIKVTQTA